MPRSTVTIKEAVELSGKNTLAILDAFLTGDRPQLRTIMMALSFEQDDMTRITRLFDEAHREKVTA
jgi:hypothetical protein